MPRACGASCAPRSRGGSSICCWPERLIEARSCGAVPAVERALPAPLGRFYAHLEQSEARHFELYVSLAVPRRRIGGMHAWCTLAEREAQLATEADPVFRFHSGRRIARRAEPAAIAGGAPSAARLLASTVRSRAILRSVDRGLTRSPKGFFTRS